MAGSDAPGEIAVLPTDPVAAPTPDAAGVLVEPDVVEPHAADQPGPGLPHLFVAVMVLVGLGLRVLLATATASFGRPDSDEVIAGLMARHIGDDGYPLFFWGQHYGGTPTLGLDAVSLRLFGTSVVAMRIPTVVFAAGCSLLVWRVAARLLDRRAAQTAGLLSWVGAPPAVFFSTRDHLFYVPTVFFGLVAALTALRIRDRAGSRAWNGIALIGALGLGVWCMPTIVYFAIPTLFVLGYDPAQRRIAAARSARAPAHGPDARFVVVGLGTVIVLGGAAVIGYLWFVRAAPPAWHEAKFDYLSSFAFFFTDGLPGLLGFREIFTYRWILGPIGLIGYVFVLVVITAGLVAAVRRRAWDAVGLLALPFVFALFPKATEQPNMRYMFFAVPFVAIAVARVAAGRRWRCVVAVVVALLLSSVSLQRLYVVSEVDRSTRVGLVGDVDAAIAVLDEQQIHAAYANYWIAYRISFESGERIVATPPFKEERYHRYAEQVAGQPRIAWVVSRGEQLDGIRTSMRELGVAVVEREAGDFVVVLPDRVVRPDELGGPVRAVV